MNRISLIEVEGAAGPAGRTGAGLKIGDDLSDLTRIYGPRYHLRNIPNREIHDVMIQWRKEEFSLVAELDRWGKITSSRSSAGVIYPAETRHNLQVSSGIGLRF